MRVCLSIVLLLSMTVMSMAAGQPLILKGNPPAGQQESELTPEEEEEARAVALRFSERWQAKHDFGQIIAEMFVKDFSERLWQVPHNELPWMLVDKDLIVQASPAEMRRYYAATMNFYGLYFNLHEAVAALREKSEKDEGDLKVDEVLSPEIINVLLNNPTFVELAELAGEAKSDERTKEDDNRQPAESADSAQTQRATAEADAGESTEQSEIGIIKRVPQLNDAAATLEKANELMRQRLAKMSRPAKAASRNDEAEESKEDTAKPHLTSLNEAEYGHLKDTPVIHVDALPFCLDLIKIDGRLMILSVSIYID